MLFRSICTQIAAMLHRRSALISFYIVLGFALTNFLTNVMTYQGYDIINMVHPMQLLLLSDESGILSFYFIQLYPLLVVLPAGFSFALDRESNEVVFQSTRVGLKNYFLGKLFAAFLVTFFIFTFPLLLEIALNCLAFPLNTTGNLDNVSFYDSNYIDNIRTYLWSGLFIAHPYFYAVFCILLFGLVSGVLSIFTIAISTFRIEYKVLLFLPAWLLLHGVGMLGQLIPFLSVDTGYTVYLQLYDSGPKSGACYLLLVGCLALYAFCVLFAKCREDWLQ